MRSYVNPVVITETLFTFIRQRMAHAQCLSSFIQLNTYVTRTVILIIHYNSSVCTIGFREEASEDILHCSVEVQNRVPGSFNIHCQFKRDTAAIWHGAKRQDLAYFRLSTFSFPPNLKASVTQHTAPCKCTE